MSPRSEELLASARDRLGAARAATAAGFHSSCASNAYYAMLYAARAALSETDQYARTHSGTWGLFRGTFVADGRFDAALFSAAQSAQQRREAADYDAVMISREEAERLVELADRFVSTVSDLIED